jgi:transcriptional regulator GlxA family with amidase domain
MVLYPGAQNSTVLGLTDLFTIANRFVVEQRELSSRPIRISHWQREDGDGQPKRVFDTHPHEESSPTALILPSVLGDPPGRSTIAPYIDWLRERHAAGTIMSSVCAGAFLLAETGLLDDRSATTHWMYAGIFRARFARTKLEADRLIVDDGDIITAGGAMSWTDLGLKLLDRLLGPNVMIRTSRILLIDPPGREQRYYSFFSPNMTHGDPAILKVQHWLQATAARDIALKSLVSISGLEERTLLRRFRKATGMTTSEYCQRLRVGRAREMLQSGRKSIENIAWEVGYGDAGSFSRLFVKIVGLTPGDYRQRFSAG